MFVVSLSSKKLKLILSIVLVALIGVGVGSVTLYECSKKEDAKPNTELMVNNSASDMTELMEFISSFGWEVKNEPDEVREIIIPTEFDDVYKRYNEIQIAQGYDLKNYAGRRVKKWCFTIKNYPEYDDADYIKINILVCDGSVIGGDVCSIKLDGFMHGFSAQ